MVWKFRKVGPSHIQETCVVCHERPQTQKSNGKYRAICGVCDKKMYRRGPEKPRDWTKPYRKSKATICARCGFIPECACQLDVDHIDGDRSNNSKENLQTLCANCHRLKSHKERVVRLGFQKQCSGS